MHQATVRMLGIVGLAALLASPVRAGDKGALPDDLKLVSGKGGGFVSVRVADLLKSDTAKTLLQKMAQMEPKVDIDKEMSRELGIGPTQMERVTVLLPESFETEPVFVFWTTKAIDREKMFANLRNPPEKKEHQGRTYYTSKFGGTYFFLGDRVFVAAPNERSMTAWLDEDPAKIDAGPYRPALLQASKGTAVVAVVGQSLLNKMAKPLPQELSGPLTEAKAALLTVLGDKDTRLDLRLTFADAKVAKAASGALKGTLGFSREQIPLLRGELNQVNNQGGQVPEAARWAFGQADQFLQQADKALADAQVSTEGATVHARARAQTSAGQFVVMMGMGTFVGRAEARAVAPPPAPKKEEKKKDN